jgi:hypothetical protein
VADLAAQDGLVDLEDVDLLAFGVENRKLDHFIHLRGFSALASSSRGLSLAAAGRIRLRFL